MKLIHRNGEVIILEDDGTQRVIPLSGVEIETEARGAEDLDFSAENFASHSSPATGATIKP